MCIIVLLLWFNLVFVFCKYAVTLVRKVLYKWRLLFSSQQCKVHKNGAPPLLSLTVVCLKGQYTHHHTHLDQKNPALQATLALCPLDGWESKQAFLNLSFLFFMVTAALLKWKDELKLLPPHSKQSSRLPPFGQKCWVSKVWSAHFTACSVQNRTFLKSASECCCSETTRPKHD